MATEETKRQTTVELEHQFAEKLNAVKEEAAADRAKLEASMAEMKAEWSGELAKLEDDRDLATSGGRQQPMSQRSAQRDERIKGNQELRGRGHPQGVANVRAVGAERARQQGADERERGRLPYVVEDVVRHRSPRPLIPDP